MNIRSLLLTCLCLFVVDCVDCVGLQAEAVKLRQEVDSRTNRVAAENEKVKAAIILMEAQTSEAQADLISQRQICKELKHTLELECTEHTRVKLLVKELVRDGIALYTD